MRRVVITGMGIVSSIGNNTQEVLASLHEAKSGISRAEKYAGFSLDYGSVVLFMGRKYRIETDYENEDVLYFPPGLDPINIEKKLISFYKKKAGEIIPDRVAYFARLIGKYPTEIRIGSAKKSWGSCSSSGRLTFSWRLMMASPDAIDYVVVHELAHLKQLNHSHKFWNIVAGIIPAWKERRKELRLLQRTMPF